MNRTELLDQLFNEWQSYPSHEVSFLRDGIIDEEKFHPRRVLFLCKEPNQSKSVADVERQGFGDYRTWWKQPLWGAFSYNLSTWAHGVLNDFVPYDQIPADSSNALHSIAFMNLKKSGGIGDADMKELLIYTKTHKEFIEREIKIIEPSLIIASIDCRTFDGVLFDAVKRRPSGHGIDVYEWLGIPVIDFYHPTLRGGVCLTYALLKLVVGSDVVREKLPGPPW